MSWHPKNGLDNRFMMFVIVTMIASAGVSIVMASLVLLVLGNAKGSAASLVFGAIGGGLVFGPMLVIGLFPSALAFALAYHMAGGDQALPLSAEYAGVATAGVASVFWTAVLTIVNGDGAEIVLAIIGISAVLLAPFIARWAYRPNAAAGARPGPDALGSST